MAITPASIRKHPIHPMLIAFPIGLWVFSLVCDLAFLATGKLEWLTVSFYSMAGGLVGALAAAVPGAIDLFSLPSGHLRKTGMMHMGINLLVMVLYAINIGFRTGSPEDMTGPIWLAVASVALLGVSGWLGADLVHVHGVGVDTHAIAAPVQPPAAKTGSAAPRQRA